MTSAAAARLPAALVALAALGACLLIAGCGGGDSGGNAPPRVGGALPNAFGADCAADLSRFSSAVYVSSKAPATPSGCGSTTANACSTIQQGIDACAASGCAVLVRYGRYPTSATINLRDGVSVYGGCVFASDGDVQRAYRTVIDATPAPGSPAIRADAIASPTTLSGIVVVNNDERANDAASIALALSGSKALALSRSTLAAGIGGRGADGAPATPAQRGQDGGNSSRQQGGGGAGGGPACPSAPVPEGRGGAGGNALAGSLGACFTTCTCFYDRGPDLGGDGGASGASPGGPGSRHFAFGGFFCSGPSFGDNFEGRPGGAGNAGECATAAASASSGFWGSFAGVAWRPDASAQAGATGHVGSGGGGGSSGGYCVDTSAVISGTIYPAVPAGGGGGGGCGGNAGGGGHQGGASIGLLLGQSSLTLGLDNVVVPAPGGNGGNGGSGGAGGAGGNGGNGAAGGYKIFDSGSGTQSCPGPSGGGGAGGPGGAGGGGAGGNGGPSIGIALAGGSASPGDYGVYAALPISAAGSGGAGGTGGLGNCSAPRGADGAAGKGGTVIDYARLPP